MKGSMETGVRDSTRAKHYEEKEYSCFRVTRWKESLEKGEGTTAATHQRKKTML